MGRGLTVRIALTPEEKQTLIMWMKASTSEQRLVQRAKIVLLSAQGLNLPEVSLQSGLSRQNWTPRPTSHWPLPRHNTGGAPSGHGPGLRQAPGWQQRLDHSQTEPVRGYRQHQRPPHLERRTVETP